LASGCVPFSAFRHDADAFVGIYLTAFQRVVPDPDGLVRVSAFDQIEAEKNRDSILGIVRAHLGHLLSNNTLTLLAKLEDLQFAKSEAAGAVGDYYYNTHTLCADKIRQLAESELKRRRGL
jgi:hypothetical protein